MARRKLKKIHGLGKGTNEKSDKIKAKHGILSINDRTYLEQFLAIRIGIWIKSIRKHTLFSNGAPKKYTS